MPRAYARFLPPRSVAIAAALLVLIGLYLLAFRWVPMFFDEVAFRRFYGRAFLEGFSQLNYFPICSTPKPVPLVFIPAHAFLSWMDGWDFWVRLRLVPTMSVLALAAATAGVVGMRAAPWTLAMLTAGFVGLSGAGLVLSRWEVVIVLHVTACLLTWTLAGKSDVPRWVKALVLALHLAIVNISLFVHLQGVLLVPLSALTIWSLLRRHPWWAGACTAAMALLSVQTITSGVTFCPEDPDLVETIWRTQGVLFPNQLAGLSGLQQIAVRGWHYVAQFLFQPQEAYSIPVPPVPGWVSAVMALPVAAIVIANLVLLVAGAVYCAVRLWRTYAADLLGFDRRVLNAAFDARALWLLAAMLLLAYSIYDVAGLYYRADLRNLLTAVLLAIAGGYALRTGLIAKLARGWSIVSVAGCTLSAVVAWTFLWPQFVGGFESTYVSLHRDWPAFNQQVRATAEACGLGPEDGRIVVDNATYDALSGYPSPIDYGYGWYTEYLKGTLDPAWGQSEWLDYYRKFGASGFVVMCRSLVTAPLPVQYSNNGLCCGSLR